MEVRSVDPSTGGPSGEPTISDLTFGGTLASDGRPGGIDEAAVVAAVLGGEREAFRLIVERELPAVVRTCARILSDASEAEDVAQEAFVTAYRSLASWRGEGPLGAWLSRIAVRLAFRRVSRRRVVTWTAPSDAIDDEGPLTRLPAGIASDPEHSAVRNDQARQLRAAVAGLDEPYREVVALRFFADRSLDEIAELTGRPLGTVKTHLRRGLIRLRDGIGAEA